MPGYFFVYKILYTEYWILYTKDDDDDGENHMGCLVPIGTPISHLAT